MFGQVLSLVLMLVLVQASNQSVANTSCRLNNTQFPSAPWHTGGWACRFSPCAASADFDDHDPCMHGGLRAPHFHNTTWPHASEARVHAIHESVSTPVPARTLANPIARRPNIGESHSGTPVL